MRRCPRIAKCAGISLPVAGLIIAVAFSTTNSLAQSGSTCAEASDDFRFRHDCRYDDDPDCPWCDLSGSWTPHSPQEFSTRLSDQDTLLFLSYGISAGLAAEIDAATWQNPVFGGLTAATRQSFATLWHVHRYEERVLRTDLVPYFETVLPAEQRFGAQACDDCEFTLSMGLVWGYRWSTLSGRMSADTASIKRDVPPEYGFRFLHQASPRWRYVLALDHDSDTLDVVGEAMWQIRPDAYLSLAADIADYDLLSWPPSDFKLHFSFD